MTDYEQEIIFEYSDSDSESEDEQKLGEYEYVFNGIRFTYYFGYEI